MLRVRAVNALLVEEVGGLRLPGEAAAEGGGEGAEAVSEPRAELARASRKALRMVALCWVAIAVLFSTHPQQARFLVFAGLDTVFTLGILVVAIYSGFRLGQWEKYRAIARAVDELAERE